MPAGRARAARGGRRGEALAPVVLAELCDLGEVRAGAERITGRSSAGLLVEGVLEGDDGLVRDGDVGRVGRRIAEDAEVGQEDVGDGDGEAALEDGGDGELDVSGHCEERGIKDTRISEGALYGHCGRQSGADRAERGGHDDR